MSFGLSVLGSINLDLIVQTQNLPKAGETVTGGVYTALPGGKGANVAIAAKRLGAETEIIAAVGADDYAAQALINLEAEGVYLDAVKQVDAHTGLAFITVSEDGENQIAVASGANAAFLPTHLPKLCSDVLITQFEIPIAVIEAALEGYEGFVAVNAWSGDCQSDTAQSQCRRHNRRWRCFCRGANSGFGRRTVRDRRARICLRSRRANDNKAGHANREPKTGRGRQSIRALKFRL